MMSINPQQQNQTSKFLTGYSGILLTFQRVLFEEAAIVFDKKVYDDVVMHGGSLEKLRIVLQPDRQGFFALKQNIMLISKGSTSSEFVIKLGKERPRNNFPFLEDSVIKIQKPYNLKSQL